MALEWWDPFREVVSLREAMDRLLERYLVRSSTARPIGSIIPLDIAEREDAFVVKASLPGIRPEDIEVSVVDNLLTIRAKAGGEEERRGENWLLRERHYGSFQRTVRLPAGIDADRAEARYEHGVLILTLPKVAEARARRIPILAGERRYTEEQAASTTLPGQTAETPPATEALGHSPSQSSGYLNRVF
jgi:HSP20 family protein